MISHIIRASIESRAVVLLAALGLLVWGSWVTVNTPVDALPDLSDVQVIVKTEFAGQAPQVIEDQVTYPLTSALMAVPKATDVRGISMFGTSYVYVLFEDNTDIYWARSRVLEYLSQIQSRLPSQVNPQLGPDATGVGWVFNYALVDRTGQHDLAQLRSLQDWYLKPQLQSVSGVSEVASLGGMVRQYQVMIDPHKLRAYDVTLPQLRKLLADANRESGASVVELAEAEYMVRLSGYIDSLEDLKKLPIKITDDGFPVLLSSVAQVRLGPAMRRGVAELNGEGEVAGAIVVMRYGENAAEVISAVKQKLDDLKQGLPDGVSIIVTYDRSQLVKNSVATLTSTLILQLLIVVAICALFLWHFRSSLVVLLSLPLGILGAFVLMSWQGLNANIMSLGGIAVAIGSMVDGAIVMLENAHKTIDRFQQQSGRQASRSQRWSLIQQSSVAVGPALFLSMLIEAVSFLPVLSLQAQEGRLFSPLAFTKSYAMVVAAGLTITLIPVLMGYCLRGKIRPERDNPINRQLINYYQPVLQWCLNHRGAVVSSCLIFLLASLWPLSRLGTEFMSPLDEGDLMYMPTTQPSISIGEARRLLQTTDKLIKSQPEVSTVFGKIGRAETATDPAPLNMIETVIQFKPKHLWRDGVTREDIVRELDQRLQLPGVSNSWVMPIRTRIDMLATGIKTPLGLVLTGDDLESLQSLAITIEGLLSPLPGAVSVYAERVAASRYIRVDIDRTKTARYGLSIAELHNVAALAIGGEDVTQTLEGLERYPVNLRYERRHRSSLKALRNLAIKTPSGQDIVLMDVAEVYVESGPSSIRTENTRPSARILIDVHGQDLQQFIDKAEKLMEASLILPKGYSYQWSGQYQYLERAKSRLSLIIPMTVLSIIALLYLTFGRGFDVAVAVLIIPFSLCGGIWLLWFQSFSLSIVVVVGFIALAGVSVGNGVMMMVYLNQALSADKGEAVEANSLPPITTSAVSALNEKIVSGATGRIRPVIMTVLTILIGLMPALMMEGTGSEVMQRIAAPMVGGIVSSMLMTLLLIPVLYSWWYGERGEAILPSADTDASRNVDN